MAFDSVPSVSNELFCDFRSELVAHSYETCMSPVGLSHKPIIVVVSYLWLACETTVPRTALYMLPPMNNNHWPFLPLKYYINTKV